MGLDGVELVMECEDEFGIIISDDDATATTTPGQLTSLVIRLLRRDGSLHPPPACPSAKMFYELRKGLTKEGIERSRIKPSHQIGQVLTTPQEVRRSAYMLRTHIGNITHRTMTDQVFRFLAPALVIATSVPIFYFSTISLHAWSVPLVCMVLVLIFVLVFAMYSSHTSELIDPNQTLGELIEQSISSVTPFDTNTDELMIWLRVRTIVAEQLGASIDDVKPDADFVKDLGMC